MRLVVFVLAASATSATFLPPGDGGCLSFQHGGTSVAAPAYYLSDDDADFPTNALTLSVWVRNFGFGNFRRGTPLQFINSVDTNYIQPWLSILPSDAGHFYLYDYRTLSGSGLAGDHVARTGEWTQLVLTFAQDAVNATLANFTVYAVVGDGGNGDGDSNHTVYALDTQTVQVDRSGQAIEFKESQDTYLMIGPYAGGPGEIQPSSGWFGQVDEVALWNRVLTGDEIAAIATTTPDSAASEGLVLYYPFEEGSGSVTANWGSAGDKYDLLLGETVTGTIYVDVSGGAGGIFAAPTWSVTDAALASDGTPTALNYTFVGIEDKELLLTVNFDIANDHPQGLYSTVTIATPPLGDLYQYDGVYNTTTASFTEQLGALIEEFPATVEFPLGFLFYQPPADLSGDSVDSFTFYATDERGSVGNLANVTIDLVQVDDRPTAPSQAVGTLEEEPVEVTLAASDGAGEGQHLTVVVTALPEHGKLLKEDGSEITHAFSAWAFEEPIVQFVKEVAEVSTYWAYPGGFGWHAFQIIGEQDVFIYGDARATWCPLLRKGDSDNGGAGWTSPDFVTDEIEAGLLPDTDDWLWDDLTSPNLAFGPHDQVASFDEFGYTEFIVVDFEEPVYVYELTIGENRGMGSVVGIWAMNDKDTSEGYQLLWEGEADPSIQERHALIEEYRNFVPAPLCQHGFTTKRIRIELDTQTVEDWNEIDYVKLVGANVTQSSIMDNLYDGNGERIDPVLTYVPDDDFFGEDAFTWAVYDCPFSQSHASEPGTVSVSIANIDDAPRLDDFALDVCASDEADDCATASSTVAINLPIVEADGDAFALKFTDIPDAVTLTADGSVIAEGVNVCDDCDLAAMTLTASGAECPNTAHSAQFHVTDAGGSTNTATLTLSVKGCKDPCSVAANLLWTEDPPCKSNQRRTVEYSWDTTHCDPDTGDDLPADEEIECDQVVAGSGVGKAVTGMSYTGAVFALLVTAWVVVHRNKWNIRASQPVFCVCFAVGCAASCFSNLLFLGENDNCMGRAWAVHISFTVTFAGLFVKVWRVFKIFLNKSLRKMRVTNVQTFASMMVIVFTDVFVLFLWTAVDPSKSTTSVGKVGGVDNIVSVTCQSGSNYFQTTSAILKVVMILAGCVMSYQTRHVESTYSESKPIMLAIYQMTILGGLAMLVLSMNVPVEVSLLMQCIASVVGATGALILVFGPKLHDPSVRPEILQTAISQTPSKPGAAVVRSASSISSMDGDAFSPVQPGAAVVDA